nr:uncharacterized protein LOC115270318 [Aedes albopictus]
MPPPVEPRKMIQKLTSIGQEKRSTNYTGSVDVGLPPSSMGKGQQEKQQGTKFIRPCHQRSHREQQQHKHLQQRQSRILFDGIPLSSNTTTRTKHQQKTSDNVNQPNKKNPVVKAHLVEIPKRKKVEDRARTRAASEPEKRNNWQRAWNTDVHGYGNVTGANQIKG